MGRLAFLQKEFNAYLKQKITSKEPVNLYNPVLYIMNLGGKRLRPALTLLAADLLGGDYKKAMPAALAIEVFHNFSLVHDDIMDDAPLRRGKKSVHVMWDVNTGILSGDVMLVQVYQFLGGYRGQVLEDLLHIFNDTALKVCEGQQYDMDFESREDVTVDEYLTMISFKTAVLIAAALKMGAVIANASPEQQEAIYNYGVYLGTAFQLQDDYLDAFAEGEGFGKQVGGDIIENKKTYLYLKAREMAGPADKQELMDLYSLDPRDTAAKVKVVKAIFKKSGADKATKEAIEAFTLKAFEELDALNDFPEAKKTFMTFGKQLMSRKV